MIRCLSSLLLVAACLGCTSDSDAVNAAQAIGLTNVRTTGLKPFSCSKDDVSMTGFEATNIHGNSVSGVVCCGLLKGCTVRFE